MIKLKPTSEKFSQPITKMSLPSEFKYDDEKFQLTKEMKEKYDKYGYIILRGLLDKDELENVKKAIDNNAEILKNAFGVKDRKGKYSKLAIWHTAGDNVTGMVARCEKVVNTVEMMLEGGVYHYYTKLMMKDPQNEETGGAHEWHQDYGYWYRNEILFPQLMTVFIAIDRAHKQNGCLQILEGSHKCGRLDHYTVGGQIGIDIERLNFISKVCPLKYVELEPGDALFFHSNLIHCSGQNESQDRRYAFLLTYNRATNPAMKEHHFKSYTPLAKVPNSAIRGCTHYDITDFYDPETNKVHPKVAKLGQQ